MPKYALLFILFFIGSFQVQAQRHKHSEGVLVAHKGAPPRATIALPKKIAAGQPVTVSKVNLKDLMPPVGDQGHQNACGAWSLGYACRSFYNLEQDPVYKTIKKADDGKVISPQFIYNLLNHGENRFIELPDALRLLVDTGACSIRTWKMLPPTFFPLKQQPRKLQLAEAENFKIRDFSQIDDNTLLQDIKAQLRSGIPVIFSAYFDPVFFRDGHGYVNTKDYKHGIPYVWRTYHPDTEHSTDSTDLCHAMVFVGYDDSLRAFEFMNSYGTKWGNKGFGWLSYDIAYDVIAEAYVITPKSQFKPFLCPEAPPKPKKDSASYKPVRPGQYDDGLQSSSTEGPCIAHLANKFAAIVKPIPNNSRDWLDLGVTSFVEDCLCDTFQVAVRLFYADERDSTKKGQPVHSANSGYCLSNGQAAVLGEKQPFTGNVNHWEKLRIPLSKIVLHPGVNKLLAEVVWFNDDYPVKACTIVPLEVNY